MIGMYQTAVLMIMFIHHVCNRATALGGQSVVGNIDAVEIFSSLLKGKIFADFCGSFSRLTATLPQILLDMYSFEKIYHLDLCIFSRVDKCFHNRGHFFCKLSGIRNKKLL